MNKMSKMNQRLLVVSAMVFVLAVVNAAPRGQEDRGEASHAAAHDATKADHGSRDANKMLAFWTIACFFALLVLLKVFVIGPVGKALEERENRLKASVEGAQQAKSEAERLIAEHRKKIDEAHARAQAIIKEAREAAEKVRKETLDKASEQANEIAKKAQEQIVQEKEKSLAELRETVASLSVDVAAKAVGRQLDEADQLRLVDEFIADLSKQA